MVARSRPQSVSHARHRLASGRRRQRGRRPRRGDRHAGDAAPRVGRDAAQPRAVRAGHLDAGARLDGHARARASIAGATTTATTSSTTCRAARRPPTMRRRCPSATTWSPARASRRATTSPTGSSVWGDLGWGFRAPTLNELYRQFRVGTVLTLANNQLGPERLVGGEAGVSVGPVRNLTWRATWFDNRIKDPVSNVTLTTVPERDPAAPEPRTHQGGRAADRCGISARHRLAAVGGISLQSRAGDGVRRQPRSDRQRPAAGAAPPWIAADRLRQPALPQRRVRAAGDRRASSTTTRINESRVLPGYSVLSLTASRRVSRMVEAVRRSPEPDRPRISGWHAADDHRHAATGQRRAADSLCAARRHSVAARGSELARSSG